MIMVFFSACGNRSCFSRSSAGAFSLVEVVLALGVATFSLLAIVALLPVGIQSTKDSLEESQAIDVLSEVVADRQASPLNLTSTLYQLPALTNTMANPATGFFGITESNTFTAQLNQARYRVDYSATPPVGTRLDPYRVWFKVSWPARSANPTEFVEGIVTFAQP